MEIMYWSDIACPFCYIGANRMKQALAEVGIADETPMEFLAYELDPEAPKTTSEKGEKALGQRARAIEDMARGDGLAINLSQVKHVSTMDAHRLIKLAKDKYGQAAANRLVNDFYKLYFVKGAEIADHDVLKEAAAASGLDQAAVEAVLNSDAYEQEVRNDEAAAMQSGVSGVPFFVINGKYAINGAQPKELLVSALRQVLAMEGANDD